MTHKTSPNEKPVATNAPASRRAVLRGLSLAGLAASSATTIAAAAQARPEAEKPGDHRTLEYRETEHIRCFYELSRH